MGKVSLIYWLYGNRRHCCNCVVNQSINLFESREKSFYWRRLFANEGSTTRTQTHRQKYKCKRQTEDRIIKNLLKTVQEKHKHVIKNCFSWVELVYYCFTELVEVVVTNVVTWNTLESITPVQSRTEQSSLRQRSSDTKVKLSIRVTNYILRNRNSNCSWIIDFDYERRIISNLLDDSQITKLTANGKYARKVNRRYLLDFEGFRVAMVSV